MKTFKATIQCEVEPDGRVNIMILIEHQQQTVFLHTDMRIEPGLFDRQRGQVSGGTHEQSFNRQITGILRVCEQQYAQLPDPRSLSARQIGEQLLAGGALKAFRIRSRIGNIEL